MDCCCLNRPADDQTQDKIRIESDAVIGILFKCFYGSWKLIGSDIVEYEILNIDAKVRSPFDYKIYFKSGEVESGSDYVNLADSRWDLDWYRKSDARREEATVNMVEARWTGNDDGSLVLGAEHIIWTPREKRTADRIEKIVFIPARKGYLSCESYDD
jgi:hypothetical protein